MAQGPPYDPAAQALLDALSASITRTKFSPERFFSMWFPLGEGGLFFLFRKNLAVTNIQYAELLALLREYTTHADLGPSCPPRTFSSPNDFKALAGSLVQQLIDSAADVSVALRLAVELYAPLFESLIVVRPLYGSCVTYLPPRLKVDLISICGMSGYIHSCGPVVYIRRLDKAKKVEFFDVLDKYLVRYSDVKPKPVFAAYAHEDFSAYDRERPHVREDLRHGLDDVKLHVEKVNMGTTRLVSVLEEMRNRYSTKLEMTPPGDYRVSYPSGAKNTLWLIGDTAVDHSDLTKPGTSRYLVCYDQWYYNDSPYFIFDENKPAWVSHTTIPHTLLAAMLNITRPWPTDVLSLADPFAGTGTTLLEAAKDARLSVRVGDLNPVVPNVIGDNVAFFGLPPGEVKQVVELLASILERLPERDVEPDTFSDGELFPGPLTVFRWARRLLDSVRPSSATLEGEVRFSPETVTALLAEPLESRIVFYVFLRGWIRGQGALYRHSLTMIEAFRNAGRELLDELKDFNDWTQRSQYVRRRCGHLAVFGDGYSDRCAIDPARLRRQRSLWDGGQLSCDVRDARSLEARSYDLIVTDPPYGFNTDEELIELARLYRDFIRTCVKALKDRGHLVLSLPESSKIGRPVPAFTRAEVIVPSILAAARNEGLCVEEAPETLPTPQQLFSAPYYWQSEKALTRTVLHFRFRRTL
jgi:hypothetical protein